jgi:hypothetical protein
MANADDAVAALPTLSERGLRNLRSKGQLVSEHEATLPALEGTTASWGVEQEVDGHSQPSAVLLWGYAIGHYLVVYCASGSPPWTIPELQVIAETQTTRLRA